MAGYIRQSTFVDGDTITAALFNDEYNQLVNAFSNTSGHKHDGTTAEGPIIGLIGDAGETSPNNKVLIDTTNNYIEFYVEVSSAPVQQLYIADGAIIPVTDSDIDLGTTSLRFKDTYTDTVTTTGNVSIGGDLTVTGSATISGNLTFGDADTDSINLAAEIDSNIVPNTDDTYDLGTSSKQWKDLYIDGTANIDSLVADTADINGGTIDGATIATSDVTVGAGKTLDVSAGTLTLADNQISGDKVEGGTIAATTITDLTFGSLNDGTITITAFADEDDMSSNSATLLPTQQSVKAYVDSQVTAQDLDFQGDTGGALSIDLDSESLTIAGGTGLDTVGSGNTVTVNIDSTVATLTGTQTLTNKTLTSPDVNTPDIDGGTIDSSVIGGTTPAAGTFTTLTANTSITGTLATAAQPNITSVGTLTSLTSSSNITVSNSSGHGSIELGGSSGGFIDLKTPASDDFDARIIYSGSNLQLLTNADEAILLRHNSDTKLATNSSGINITGTLTADGLTVDGIVAISSTTPTLRFFETDQTDEGTLLRSAGDSFQIAKMLDSGSADGIRLAVDQSSGDISFYDDTGTSQALYWDASAESLGIGTTSPSVALEISDSTANAILRLTRNDTIITAGNQIGALEFAGADTDDAGVSAKIIAEAESGAGQTALAMYTGTPSALSERLRIDKDGNVGIGTASPARELELSAANPRFRITDTDGGYAEISGNTGHLSLQADLGNTQAGSRVTFDIDGSEKMRIDSSGNVGIGTSSPDGILHLDLGTPDIVAELTADSPTFTYRNGTGAWFHAGKHPTNDYFYIGNGATTTTNINMVVNSSGNVGIKNTSPAALLHIGDSTNSLGGTAGDQLSLLTLESDTTNTDSLLFTTERLSTGNTWTSAAHKIQRKVDASKMGYIQFGANNDDLVTFGKGSTEYVRIDGDGNLLVGKTATDIGTVGHQFLSDGQGDYAAHTSNGTRALLLNRKTSDGEIVDFRKDGSTVGSIGTDTGYTKIVGGDGTNGSGLLFSDSKLYPVNAAGSISDNSIDIGVSTHRFKDLYLSGDAFVNKTTKTATGSGIVLDGDGFAYFVRDGAVQLLLGNDDTGGTSQESIRFVRNASDVGSIDTTSTATSYNTSSDYRLKENVDYDFNALDRVAQLKPARFNFIANADTTVDGFLAHEVQDIVPEAISGVKDEMQEEEYEITPAVLDEDGNVVTEAVMGTREVPKYQGIDQSKLVPLLTKAIQEQQTIIDNLTTRIEALEG